MWCNDRVRSPSLPPSSECLRAQLTRLPHMNAHSNPFFRSIVDQSQKTCQSTVSEENHGNHNPT